MTGGAGTLRSDAGSRFPVQVLTRFGVGVLGAGLVALAIAWLSNWIEFLVAGAGCIVALVLAIPHVVGGNAVGLERRFERKLGSGQLEQQVEQVERVAVGDEAWSVLLATNRSSRRSGTRVVLDRVNGSVIADVLPSMGAGSAETIRHALPTDRRGVIAVGPAVLTKADPLGLMARTLGEGGTSELRVHPRTVPLTTFQAGFATDLDGPTHDSSLAGTVTFHAIRDYETGDDVRHVHWMSTAKTGTLKVRQFIDNRRPNLAVVVDVDAAAVSGEQFERALEVAASQILNATEAGRPLSLWVGDVQIVSGGGPIVTSVALDQLCEMERRDDAPALVTLVDRARRADPDVSGLLVVTGPRPATELVAAVSAASHQGRAAVTRFVEPGTSPVAVPQASVLDCVTLDDFADRWGALVR